MAEPNRYELLKVKIGAYVVDDPTLRMIGVLLGLKDYEIKGIKNNNNGNLQMATADVIRRWQGRQDQHDGAYLADKLEVIFKDHDLAMKSDFAQAKDEIDQNYPAPPADQPAAGEAAGAAAAAREPPSDSAAPTGNTRDQDSSAHAHGGHMEMADFDVPAVPDLLRYKIKEYKKLGRVVIINNKSYTSGEREGTDVDEARIREVTDAMGLELTDASSVDTTDGLAQPEMFVLKDRDVFAIRETLEKVADMDHSDYACFCCFVLSHGNDRCVRTVDGASLSINDLTGFFKGDSCPSLIGKPKLFFIQACQGGRVDRGTIVEQADDDSEQRSLPSEADVFIFYATPFGYKSWRHPTKGSRFIQCLCAALEELHPDTEIMEITALVNEMVSQLEGESGYKQVSMVTSTLRKQFFFKHQRRK